MLVRALTAISAFVTSTPTLMPAIAMFASFVALSFTVALPVTFSSFLSLLVLDERRLRAGRISFAPCVRTSVDAAEAARAPPGAMRARSDEPPKTELFGRVQRVIRDRYALALLAPRVAALVVALSPLASALGMPHIRVGLRREDIMLDDSYTLPALALQKSTFGVVIEFWRALNAIELDDGPFTRRLHRLSRQRRVRALSSRLSSARCGREWRLCSTRRALSTASGVML